MDTLDLLNLIRTQGIYLEREPLEALFALSQADYDTIVSHLLVDNVGVISESRLAGCVLFAIRPSPWMYSQVLKGAIEIDNPSDIRDGGVALLQVKSPDQVVEDLLEHVDPSRDRHTAAIFSIFYWIGFTPNSLRRNQPWPGYSVSSFLHHLGELQFDPKGLTTSPITHPVDPDFAEAASLKALTKMIDLFEQNNANQTARGVISLLTLISSYPPAVEARMPKVIVLAQQSSDAYVRHRAQMFKQQP
jgi:hypothetical protein